MKIVVQMLEGDDNLTMPPNPFASTGTTSTNTNLVKNTSSERASCHLRMRVEVNFNTLNTSSMYRCNLTLLM